MNSYTKSKYYELTETITGGEKYLAENASKEGAIWAMTELTEEARRSRVYDLARAMNEKRNSLYQKASAALGAIREEETVLRQVDGKALQSACSVIATLGSDCNRDVISSLIAPLKDSQGALASLWALCDRRKVNLDAFEKVMYCKYDEYHDGTPITPEEYYAEAERYLENYFGMHEGRVVPQTIMWLPNWTPRVNAQALLMVLSQIAKLGGFDATLIDPEKDFGAQPPAWTTDTREHYETLQARH